VSTHSVSAARARAHRRGLKKWAPACCLWNASHACAVPSSACAAAASAPLAQRSAAAAAAAARSASTLHRCSCGSQRARQTRAHVSTSLA
jgi:hypothetical protein